MTASVSTKDKLTLHLSRGEIAAAVDRLASEVRRDYHPLTLSLSKGERRAQPSPAHGELRPEVESSDRIENARHSRHLDKVGLVEPRAVNEPPLLVGVLKGAFVFMADLIRALDMPLEVDFVRISTYGPRTQSSGRPRIDQGIRSPIKGRHLLVVEDIVDTGVTTHFLMDYLCKKGAASVKLCALLSKPARRQVDVNIDYLGFTISDLFVVGYGLDFAQRYRHLPDIYVLEQAR